MVVKSMDIYLEHKGETFRLNLYPDKKGGIIRGSAGTRLILMNADWRDVDAELVTLGIPFDVQSYVPVDWL